MKKRSFIITAIAIVVAMSVVATAAAVYFTSQARMSLFSGHIEQSTSKPNDPKLVLKVAGLNVGQNDDCHASSGVTFPILTDVTGYSMDGLLVWADKTGREAISAPNFTLSAENGDVNNVYYKIVVCGNDEVAEALQFGVTIKYPKGDTGYYTYNGGLNMINHGQTETTPRLLKADSGTVAENEDIEVFVSAWVDSVTLAAIGEYDESALSVEIVFFTKD